MLRHEHISAGATSIRLISDRHSAELFDAVAQETRQARRVHFLGFSFDDVNMSNLGIDWRIERHGKLFGTSLNLGSVLEQRLAEDTDKKLTLHSATIDEYLKNHQAL